MNPKNPTQYQKDLDKYLKTEDFIKWKGFLVMKGIDELYAENILVLAFNDGYGAALDHVNDFAKNLVK